MKKISSEKTFLIGRFLPILTLGGSLALGLLLLLGMAQGGGLSLLLAALLAFGLLSSEYLFVRRNIRPIAEEVYDAGDGLQIKKWGKTIKVHLGDIDEVRYLTLFRTVCVKLTIAYETRFGTVIIYVPKGQNVIPQPATEALIRRIKYALPKRDYMTKLKQLEKEKHAHRD